MPNQLDDQKVPETEESKTAETPAEESAEESLDRAADEAAQKAGRTERRYDSNHGIFTK